MRILILLLTGFVFYSPARIKYRVQEISPSQIQTAIHAGLIDFNPFSCHSIGRNIFRDIFTAAHTPKEITAINTASQVVEINDFYIFRSWQVKDTNRKNLFLTLNIPVEINST